MCTAITYAAKDHYFGRTLDHETSYGECVAITPRNYPFTFRKAGKLSHHYAMIGMAAVVDGFPLYYEATNEKGLSMAGLHFPGNADYKEMKKGADNVAPFEFIPWILGQCATVAEARKKLTSLNMVRIDFSPELPLSPLHWIIADRHEAITVESVQEGLKIYDNPVGVLTNNPPFVAQMDQYRCSGDTIPGGWSSEERFVRAAKVRNASVSGDSEDESVSQFFHILRTVEQPRGINRVEKNIYKITIYTSCCNIDRGIYYYTTYEQHQITGIDMYKEELDASEVKSLSIYTGI